MPSDLREQLQSTLGSSYTVERELGGGGMSRVFLADEPRLGRKVVVKVLAPDSAAGVSAGRFEREIRLAGSLQQANIVPVLTAGQVDGLPYYTMPYVEGESLRARLIDGPLPVAQVVSILRDVARALAYAHRHGVVHRDVKPDNVLLSEGAAMVTDFGIAKALSAARTPAAGETLTRVGTAIGTPAYMAPEQTAADPAADHRADIYAFGVTAYELLAGRPPFHGLSPRKLLAAQLGERPKPINELRPDVPPALAELVMRCLEKDADARPQSAAALVGVLDTVTSGADLPATPTALLGGRGMLRTALLLYAGAFIGVTLLARTAVVGIGLPDWVVPGAVIIMTLGLPVILATGYVHSVADGAYATTPTLTPSGAPARPSTLATLAAKASPHISWRRTALGGVVAVGFFALVVAGYMLLRALGLGPAGSLLAAGKLAERAPLLVTDFRSSGADSGLAAVASEAVRTTLGQSSVVKIVPASTVAGALERMERPVASRLDLPLAREVAAREGIAAIVDGTVTPAGGGYIVTLRLVDAGSGDELALEHESADRLKDLLPTIDELTRRLRGKIGESLKAVRATPPLERVTTPSLSALRKYAAGVRATSFGDPAAGAALLREAVAIDTTFAMAYRKLGIALSNANMPRVQVDSALDRAYRYRDRLTERERHQATAAYYFLGPRPDRAKAVHAYEALLALDPTDWTAVNNLGALMQFLREPSRAESLFRRAMELDSSAMNLSNLLEAQFNAGHFAAAESSAALFKRLYPTSPGAAGIDLPLVYHRRRLDSVETILDSMRRHPNGAVRAISAFRRADLALLRGRLAEYERLQEAARAVNAARGSAPKPAEDSITMAWIDAWFREQPGRAIRRLDAALVRVPLRSLDPPDRPLQYLRAASVYALAGRPDRARALLTDYAADVRDPAVLRLHGPMRHTTLGEIALAEGRPREALTEFAHGDSLPDGPMFDCTGCVYPLLGRAYDRAEMPDSAIAAFERYLATPDVERLQFGWWGRARDPVYLAGVHKRLGELYDARGDRARAVSHYGRFIELWKDADPELQPKVAAARQRLAALGRDDPGVIR